MEAPRPERAKLKPFDYHGVTLDASRWRWQFDQVRDAYVRIPNDDLLRGFRARAGLRAPGLELGGWYSRDNGNIFGQLLSAFARMYAATGDEACREKVTVLVDEWGRCMAPDGYAFYSPNTAAKAYTYDKLVGGLVDAYKYCGNDGALGYLSRLTDWAAAHLNRVRDYANADGEGRPRVGWSEWYTLSENLYRAYLATDETKYRDFAEVWEYTEYWDLFARNADIFAPRADGRQTASYHAYSHVNTLSGAAAAYLVKGDHRYLDTLKNAYEFLQTQTFATGGYGPGEQLLPRDRLPATLAKAKHHFETQCGSWAAFKLCKHLISLTGDARYGDWIERLMLNGVGASIPMSADGRVFYYSAYGLGGAQKELYDDGWACCAGTQPIAVTDLHDLIYFKSADGLCVNLYCPATVRWQWGDTPVTLRQRTRFPEAGGAEFSVTVGQPAEFTIRLRAPSWLAGPMRAAVNGVFVAAGPDEFRWLAIRRVWKTGDTLSVELPMRFTLSRIATDRPYPAAILFGPVVMTVRSPLGAPHRSIDLEHLDEQLVSSRGEPLIYHVRSDSSLLVRPFYALKEGERYFMYLDPALANPGQRL